MCNDEGGDDGNDIWDYLERRQPAAALNGVQASRGNFARRAERNQRNGTAPDISYTKRGKIGFFLLLNPPKAENVRVVVI